MFTNAELTLIKELKEQKAPLERWAKFFPNVSISDLVTPKYTGVVGPYNYIVGELPPEEFAHLMKKGNIYRWCERQDFALTNMFHNGCTVERMIDIIKQRFGINRTTGAITSRLQHLNLI